MKAKACTRCRQWKVRCDASDGRPCSRCRSIKLNCVFDASFKRTPKAKHIQQMSEQIQDLRRALQDSTTRTEPITERSSNSDEHPFSPGWAPQLASLETGSMDSTIDVIHLPSTKLGTSSIISPTNGLCKTIGDVCLTAAEIGEHFRKYFTVYHQYLPFQLRSTNPEEIHATSPMLFWAICAVTTTTELRSKLAPHIKVMISEIINSSLRSVESLQALLIICMWPFSYSNMRDEPSHYYSGIATQMGLQLGLHHPKKAHSHRFGQDKPVEHQIKLTTWLACFVVSQLQSIALGVPTFMQADFHLLRALDQSPDNVLSRVVRIYHLSAQTNRAISANESTQSGLLDPEPRLVAMKLWSERFYDLRLKFEPMDDVVRIAYLSSRLKLWTFALFDDMPASAETLKMIKAAENDACDLIEICNSKNLAIAPHHVRQAMSYSGFVLVKIIRSAYFPESSEMLRMKVEQVRRVMGTVSVSDQDIFYKTTLCLGALLHLEDKQMSSPIFWRMSASLLYDLIRIFTEDKYQYLAAQDTETFDLDGIDWDELEL